MILVYVRFTNRTRDWLSWQGFHWYSQQGRISDVLNVVVIGDDGVTI